MPATIPAIETVSRVNFYLDTLEVRFWDVILGEYGGSMTFRAVTDAIQYAYSYKFPMMLITKDREKYLRAVRLLEQQGVTLVTEGADETIHKNYTGK